MDKKVNAIVLNERDSVAVAVETFRCGDTALFVINGELKELKLVTDVPVYHKFALVEAKAGEVLYKYGQVIGKVIKDINIGEHVHSHNLTSIREGLEE